MPPTSLPFELVLKICSHVDPPTLATLCLTSRDMHAHLLPQLYQTLAPGSAEGCLSLLRRLNDFPDEGYIGHFAPSIREINIAPPEKAAKAKVQMGAAIARAFKNCIENGRLPALRVLRWPFARSPKVILEEPTAVHWDEPLWECIRTLPTYSDGMDLYVPTLAGIPPTSALFAMKARCQILPMTRKAYMQVMFASSHPDTMKIRSARQWDALIEDIRLPLHTPLPDLPYP